jgi:hypothetical protein
MSEVGRPTKYKSDYAKQAAKLCALGATDADIADFFEVSRSTVNLWKIEFPEFSDALKTGKEPANERVKMSLYHRACGYSHPDVDIKVIEGQIVTTEIIKHYPPDTTACIFWLKNRLPEEFRANPEDVGGGNEDKLIDTLSALIDKLPN